MKRIKRTLAILMAVILIIGTAPLAGLTQIRSFAANSYKTGDKVYFGSYPQSKVTDSATLAKLNAAAKTWKSYNYMSGAGTDWLDGSAQPSDYMKYCDVTVGKDKYRGVKFSTYRAYCTNYQSTTSDSKTCQAENGYKINTIYWFKYDPLKWRVLDPSIGLVLCEYIIDSQPYSNTIKYYNNEYYNTWGKYANDYESSSLRSWLNNDFINITFDSNQQKKICSVKLDNSSPYSSKYNSNDTTDKIFLISYKDVTNTRYGFVSSDSANDINRRAHSTDYAKSQGAFTFTGSSYQTVVGEDTSSWWLRSPGDNSYCAYAVSYRGFTKPNDYNYDTVGYSHFGVRPALRVDNVNSLPSTPDEPVQHGKVHSVKVDDITLNYKDSATLRPVITADKDVKYTVKYESSNTKVATVDDSGNVYAAKKGTAEIKVTVTDEYGNTVTDTCTVTVKHTFIQIIIIVVLFGWIWY